MSPTIWVIVTSCLLQQGPDAKQVEMAREEVKNSCLYIDRCLLRLSKETDLGNDRVASIIAAAERTIPLFWGVDEQILDAETKKKIDAYPQQIREWMDKIGEYKSKQHLQKIEAIKIEHEQWMEEANAKNLRYKPPFPSIGKQSSLMKDENAKNGRFQSLIENANRAIKKAQKHLVFMYPGASMDKATEIVMGFQEKLQEATRGQYNAYQKHCLKRCQDFATFPLTNTIARDSSLLDKFKEFEIRKIDSGLLSSDVRRIYEICVNFMDSKLYQRNRANFLIELTESEKWKLSDF